tara:strand:- start:1230 stop:1697 length:468 start_codon:yes stop_codon:yes gene_type:complete
MELDELKMEYGEFEKKYKLPGFKELNEYFEIDKIDKENDSMLRVVRKVMMEKVVNALQFLDSLINPVNAPRIYHNYVKVMSVEDKKVIDEIYDVLGEVSLKSLGLEMDYDEKAEAELIKETFKKWEKIKGPMKKIIGKMVRPEGDGVKKDRSYFG